MSRVSRVAAVEYDALTEALEGYTPPCLGDDRYTADDIDASTRAELLAGCDLCHISTLCHAYATKARPTAGIWAGRTYTPTTGHNRKDNTNGR